jgi:hypothetical protein
VHFGDGLVAIQGELSFAWLLFAPSFSVFFLSTPDS